MLGPQGTGGLYMREGLTVNPSIRGGTGSISEKEVQPDFLPDMLESGTRNNVGIAGLGAGVDFILKQGVSKIRNMIKTSLLPCCQPFMTWPASQFTGH